MLEELDDETLSTCVYPDEGEIFLTCISMLSLETVAFSPYYKVPATLSPASLTSLINVDFVLLVEDKDIKASAV